MRHACRYLCQTLHPLGGRCEGRLSGRSDGKLLALENKAKKRSESKASSADSFSYSGKFDLQYTGVSTIRETTGCVNNKRELDGETAIIHFVLCDDKCAISQDDRVLQQQARNAGNPCVVESRMRRPAACNRKYEIPAEIAIWHPHVETDGFACKTLNQLVHNGR
jgi:hypothetical protein